MFRDLSSQFEIVINPIPDNTFFFPCIKEREQKGEFRYFFLKNNKKTPINLIIKPWNRTDLFGHPYMRHTSS